MGISAEKSKLVKRTKWEKKMELLGLKGSITKMNKSLKRLNTGLDIAEERVYELDRSLSITNLRNKEKKKSRRKMNTASEICGTISDGLTHM